MSLQAKSLLAKLLATENIAVEHRNISTAYFNVKDRVMVLPVWKEMTTDVYDLLIGHEVGHALFTPADGWHHSITKDKKTGFKSYLNVVEDARIEKLMQKKFPGLKASFKKGYQELYDKDFFGITENSWKINELPMIDRVNLHFKIGSYLNVQFTDEELPFLKQIEEIKEWKDVEEVANALYEYGKNEPNKLNWDDLDYTEDLLDLEDDFDIDDLEYGGDEEGMEGGRTRQIDNQKSLTDAHYRKMESTLVDDTGKPYVYLNCPKPDLEKIIIPYKRIAKFHNKFNLRDPMTFTTLSDKEMRAKLPAAKDSAYKKFMDNHKKYINYLVKEFELKRNARQFARVATAKTGELSIKKIHQYRFNTDLFKRTAVMPQGKSHGLLMFVDYSGSMSDNIEATIEQTVILAMFCRKVSIPFKVYAFTDSVLPRDLMNIEMNTNYRTDYDVFRDHGKAYSKFSKNKNEIAFDEGNFRLREYLSSDMSSTEFREAIRYWLLVAQLYKKKSGGYYSYTKNHTSIYTSSKETENFYLSDFEILNGTPLNETIVSSIEISKQFRKKYKLDIVNTIFLTDGDGSESGRVYTENGNTFYDKYNNDYNAIIRDAETMHEGKKPPNADITVGFLELLRNVAGVNALGFFLAPNYTKSVILSRLRKTGKFIEDFDTMYRKSKMQKFFMITNAGYNDFYIIPGGKQLLVEDDEIKVDANATKKDLKYAFLKMQKNKLVNRVLLSRFISKIA